MTPRDWFRRTTWSPEESEEFFSRLRRSRSAFHKAQYLRIQAHSLEQAGKPEAALELIEYLLKHHPEPFELATAHHTRALALIQLGHIDDALLALRDALRAERDYRGVQTQAFLDLAETEVLTHRADLYAEAREVLAVAAKKRPMIFPVERFRYYGTLALLEAAEGRLAEARELANEALKNAAEQTSGLTYHQKLGLVSERQSRLLTEVADLVAH